MMEIGCNTTKVLGKIGSTFLFEGTYVLPLKVAVKRVALEDVARTKQEEKVLERLNHPNVVALFRSESDSEFRYYALDLCKASLDKLFLKDGEAKKYCGPIPPVEDILLQLASGLEYIHDQNLAHRDLKPENALIWVAENEDESTQSQVLMKWSDFGLSKTSSNENRYWSAPELLDSEKCTIEDAKKGDVFAEGLTFAYVLLKGKHPYGNTEPEINANLRTNNPINLQNILIAENGHLWFDVIKDMLKTGPMTANEVAKHFQQIKIRCNMEIRLGKHIGRGASGQVFEGIWVKQRLRVAVKRTELLAEKNQREEEALKNLDHPNVIKCFHVEKDIDFRYYALELCEASLDQLYLKDGESKKYYGPTIPVEDIILQLANGLNYIHDKGLVHRDIKPNNVLIWVGPGYGQSEHPQVLMKWSDFGLSKQANENGSFSLSDIRGTTSWLAPEIFELFNSWCIDFKITSSNMRQRGTNKSDVFAEGLTFAFILLDGVHPYGTSRNKIISNLEKNKAVNLENIPAIYESLDEVIQDMLKTKPVERPDAKDVFERIQESIVKMKILKKKKTYAAFLVDRPYIAIRDQAREDKDDISYLMDCLRHRLRLLRPNSNELSRNQEQSKKLYDTLLRLIDEFCACGVAEIFHLLLERQIAVPLFHNGSKKHYLKLIGHITKTLSESVTNRSGEKPRIGRLAVLSYRDRNESQTSELLKQLFHIESLQRHEFRSTSQPYLSAEIGIGYVIVDQEKGIRQQTENSKFLRLLVVHVVGDIEPMWPFLAEFADYFVVEESSEGLKRVEHYRPQQRLKEIKSQYRSLSCETQIGVAIWKPSNSRLTTEPPFGIDKDRNLHLTYRCFHQVALDEKMIEVLRSKEIVPFFKNLHLHEEKFAKNCRSLFQMNLLGSLGYQPFRYHTPIDIGSVVYQDNLNFLKIREEFISQRDTRRRECENGKIDETNVENQHELLKLLINILRLNDTCSRFLAIRQLDEFLTERNHLEFQNLRTKVQKLESQSDRGDTANRMLENARAKLDKKFFFIEHLWRELIHLYADNPTKYHFLPIRAAQHLLDGFSLELLDGESNTISLDWIRSLISGLNQKIDKEKQRVFVLSVIGVRNSGKSTVLNTMFGIPLRALRTSVGTRGISIQLLAVEGRPEYDYILLLDTEGVRTRAEYQSMPSIEKRDNQLVSLAILLADATIVVNPDENNLPIKEILPIVQVAYQNSTLAEDQGGRLSSMIFFVFNRVDTAREGKISSIIQSLATSLNEARNSFRSFKLDPANVSESDVRILGKIQENSTPLNEDPNPTYGETLVEFREYIYRRVMARDGFGGTWHSRSLQELSDYIKDVWLCVEKVDFTQKFTTVAERMTYDQLESEFKTCEQKLAKAYQENFETVRKEIDKYSSNNSTEAERIVDHTEAQFKYKLCQLVDPIIENDLNKRMDNLLAKSRGKWEHISLIRWEQHKKDERSHWTGLIKYCFERCFKCETNIEKYKRKMRHEINEHFSSRELGTSQFTEAEMKDEFNVIYETNLEQAKTEFPPTDVEKSVREIFQKSFNNLLNQRNLEMKCDKVILVQLKTQELKSIGIDSNTKIINRLEKQILESGNNDQAANKEYQTEIFNYIVNTILQSKTRYDDSIVGSVISYIQNFLQNHVVIKEESVVVYGMRAIAALLTEIQRNWEEENSVPSQLEKKTNRDAMWEYFKDVSMGLRTATLFVNLIKRNLEGSLSDAFEQEMIYQTTNRVRQSQWLHDGKILRKYLDLHLICLLENNELDSTLEFIHKPQELYAIVMKNLVKESVPSLQHKWATFIGLLKTRIKSAVETAISSPSGRAKKFVDDMHRECIDEFQSRVLGRSLLIDCGDDFRECDKEDANELFGKTIIDELVKVLDVSCLPKEDEKFAIEISPKVIQHMKNDRSVKPRCDASCPKCRSLCFLNASHNTSFVKHDTVHQPSGIVGASYEGTQELVYKTCNQSTVDNEKFKFKEKWEYYRDFCKVFPDWREPSIVEEWPLREYILANYNKDIAKKCKKQPSSNIPPRYKRDLKTIRAEIERELSCVKVAL